MPTLNSITSAFVGRRPHITKSRLARAQTKKSEIDDGGWTITLDNAKTPRSEMTGYGKNLMQQRQAFNATATSIKAGSSSASRATG